MSNRFADLDDWQNMSLSGYFGGKMPLHRTWPSVFPPFSMELNWAIRMLTLLAVACPKSSFLDAKMSANSRFHIFQTLLNGVPVWIGGVEGLAEAKALLMGLAWTEPGEFFIYSETSGSIVERLVCLQTEKDRGQRTKSVAQLVSHCPRFLN